jgi:hypothetical protein
MIDQEAALRDVNSWVLGEVAKINDKLDDEDLSQDELISLLGQLKELKGRLICATRTRILKSF